MKYQNRTFRREVVELDGNEFDSCDIQYCTLIYRGGKGPSIANSIIAYSQLMFEDSALNTINLIHTFYHNGFQDMVQPTIDYIVNKPSTP